MVDHDRHCLDSMEPQSPGEEPILAKHFDFFDGPPGERDPLERDDVQEALVALWGAIRSQLSDPDSKLLGQIYAGLIEVGDGGAWAQTNRDDENQDVVNLTLELTSRDLQLNMVGGTTPQREQLEKWLKGVRSAFWRAHPDWELVVFRREATGKGFFLKAPWRELARYSAAEMCTKGFVSVRSEHGFGLDPDRFRLAYHVRRSWTRDEVLVLGGDLLPTLVAATNDILPDLRRARTTAL